MSKLRNLCLRWPIIAGVFVTLLFRGLLSLGGALFISTPNTLLFYFLDELTNILLPLAVCLLLGFGFSLTFRGFGRTLKAGLVILIVYSIVLIGVVSEAVADPNTTWQSVPVILIGILSMVGIGLREEIFFRGIITSSLALKYADSTKGLWLTVIVSGFLFGAVHMFNLLGGVTPLAAALQSVNAWGFGLLLAAVYLRGGNLWYLILVHALVDASGLFGSTFLSIRQSDADSINQLNSYSGLITVPIFALITLFLLRKSKRQGIFDRLAQLRQQLKLS